MERLKVEQILNYFSGGPPHDPFAMGPEDPDCPHSTLETCMKYVCTIKIFDSIL